MFFLRSEKFQQNSSFFFSNALTKTNDAASGLTFSLEKSSRNFDPEPEVRHTGKNEQTPKKLGVFSFRKRKFHSLFPAQISKPAAF